MIVVGNLRKLGSMALALGLSLFAIQSPVLAKESKSSKEEKVTKESKSAAKTKADSASSQASNSEAEIRAQMSIASKSLAEGDAKSLVELWTPDGVYTDVSGATFKGKDALSKRFSDLLSAEGKQFVEFVPDSLRFIAADVACSEGTVCRRDGIEGPTPETRYSMVFVNKDGKWRIASAMETLISAAAKDPLAELSFLVGEWSAEKDGSSVHMNAEWVANKHFITCKFEFKKSPDSPVLESRQIIGWDPRDQQPISWHFDSNGGFGYGSWLKKDNQWIVKATGVDPDGVTSTAVNLINMTNNNSFSWQSVNRNINGIAFNDSQALKVQRVIK